MSFQRSSLNLRVTLTLALVVLCSQFAHSQRSNAVRTTPELRTARERAEEAIKMGEFRQANLLFEQWLTALPRDTSARVLHAICLMKSALPESAMAELELAAQSGWCDTRRLNDESEFAPLKQHLKWKEVVDRVVQNAKDNAELELRFCRQERFGRYRVLYPQNYDSTREYHHVLLLHGNGQIPQIILRWARELRMSDVIFICPEAPYTKFPESLAHGMTQLSAAPNDIYCPDSLRQSVVESSAQWYLDALSDAERTLPIHKGLPILMGFSQGGFFATVVATRYPNRFRSLVLLSASYYEEGRVSEKAAALRRYGIDVLHAHGKQDATVPFQTAELLHGVLLNHGVETTFVPYEGAHWMTSDINARVIRWLESHFQKN